MAIALRASTPARSTFSTLDSWPLAFGAAVSAGDLLFAAIETTTNETVSITSIADSVNGAWTALGSPPHDQGNTTMRMWCYYYQNSGAGTPTLTVDFDGAITGVMSIAAFSGAATSGGPDAVGTPRITGGGTTTHTSNSVALSGAGAIISGLLINSTLAVTAGSDEDVVTGVDSGRSHILFTAHASGTTRNHVGTTLSNGTSGQMISAWLEAGGASLGITPIMQNYRNMGLLH